MSSASGAEATALAALDDEALRDDLVTAVQIAGGTGGAAALPIWLDDRASGFGLRARPAAGAGELPRLAVCAPVVVDQAGVIAALHAMAAIREGGATPTCAPVLLPDGPGSALGAAAGYAGCVVVEPTGWEVVCDDPAAPFAKVVARALQAERARPTRSADAAAHAGLRACADHGIPAAAVGAPARDRTDAAPEELGLDDVRTLTRALIRLLCRYGT